jgi:hypothetical protein
MPCKQLVKSNANGWSVAVRTGGQVECNSPTAKQARDNLETLAGELREQNAAQAIAKAKEDAQPDYAAANKLLRERSGGDPVESVALIIDH